MTGGIGRKALTHFYATNFIPKNPADMELVLISRTVGIDRIVDEFIAKFTHDCEIDWLYVFLPPPRLPLSSSFPAMCVLTTTVALPVYLPPIRKSNYQRHL
jgi:carboxymethylenebutenolidase